ncbi:MAG: DUF3617 domain-containing protein, partial [Pseudomonadota bacterium]
MKSALTATLLCSALVAPLHAAPDQLRPGLWEHTVEMEGGMQEAMQKLQKQLESMPPEQRQMMEKMMQSKGVPFANGAHTIKSCLSEERAKQGFAPQRDGRCQHEITERSGSTVKFQMRCSGNPPASGSGEYTFESPTS